MSDDKRAAFEAQSKYAGMVFIRTEHEGYTNVILERQWQDWCMAWELSRMAREPEIEMLRERVKELERALEVALPGLKHVQACMVALPTTEWPTRGSWAADNCNCAIKTVRAALTKEPT